jgi:hypothetical protein
VVSAILRQRRRQLPIECAHEQNDCDECNDEQDDKCDYADHDLLSLVVRVSALLAEGAATKTHRAEHSAPAAYHAFRSPQG